MAECERFPFPVNNPAASNGASIFQRCKQRGIDPRGSRQISAQVRLLGSLLAGINPYRTAAKRISARYNNIMTIPSARRTDSLLKENRKAMTLTASRMNRS